jgi:hypothetical protein
MNYQAFTNDSLTMMYEGIRGALASDDALSGLERSLDFAFVRPPSGRNMRRISSRKCSSAGCFLRSLIGRKISRRRPLSPESATFPPGERCKPAPAPPQSSPAAHSAREPDSPAGFLNSGKGRAAHWPLGGYR